MLLESEVVMLEVISIKALKNNYIWILVNTSTKTCAVIDPGDAVPIISFIQDNAFTLTAILTTHHHFDHTQGISLLMQHHPAIIYGPKDEFIPQITHVLQEGDQVTLSSLRTELKVLSIPGHTLGHIAYYNSKMLFPGDTLFGAGCGRLFEGTPQDMYSSLEKLASLPNDTLIYSAHEYTLRNLRFASRVEPNNKVIKCRISECLQLSKEQKPTLPSTIELEKASNPFLRCHLPDVIAAAKKREKNISEDPVEVFGVIRKWKDDFFA